MLVAEALDCCDLTPASSARAMLVESVSERRSGHEEAVFRRGAVSFEIRAMQHNPSSSFDLATVGSTKHRVALLKRSGHLNRAIGGKQVELTLKSRQHALVRDLSKRSLLVPHNPLITS